jgi:hypothetical protein
MAMGPKVRTSDSLFATTEGLNAARGVGACCVL